MEMEIKPISMEIKIKLTSIFIRFLNFVKFEFKRDRNQPSNWPINKSEDYKTFRDFIFDTVEGNDDEKIIIEIKSVLNMPKAFENQLYYYLRGSNYKLGYLVNFGNEHIDIRRRIYEKGRINDQIRVNQR